MTMKFLGTVFEYGRLLPAVGPVEAAKKYDCEIVTVYDDTTLTGKIYQRDDLIVGEVYITNRDNTGVIIFHNPDGFAKFAISASLQNNRLQADKCYKEFWLMGQKIPKAVSIEKIDPAHGDMYRSLGFLVIGEYVARYQK